MSLNVVHPKQTLSKETAVELKEEVTKVGFSPGGGAYLYPLINFKCLLPIFHLPKVCLVQETTILGECSVTDRS